VGVGEEGGGEMHLNVIAENESTSVVSARRVTTKQHTYSASTVHGISLKNDFTKKKKKKKKKKLRGKEKKKKEKMLHFGMTERGIHEM
jgi:hypothetical protein